MDVTLWTIRISTLLYLLALRNFLNREKRGVQIWTLAFAFYLAHAIAAFHFHHHWSHDAAVRETARQTKEMFGVDSGSGIYWNYVFTLVWGADVLWRWFGDGKRAVWIDRAVHGFLAFLFLNGAVVFAKGWMPWATVAAALALLATPAIKRLSRPVPVPR